MRAEEIKEHLLIVEKKHCKKIYPLVKPGDIIKVDFTIKPSDGELVLVSHNENQWIDKYKKSVSGYNYYKIIKVVMTS